MLDQLRWKHRAVQKELCWHAMARCELQLGYTPTSVGTETLDGIGQMLDPQRLRGVSL